MCDVDLNRWEKFVLSHPHRLGDAELRAAAERIHASYEHTFSDPSFGKELEAFVENPAQWMVGELVVPQLDQAQQVALLLSGGEDSCFLLLALKEHLPELPVRCFVARTRGNRSDVSRAEEICRLTNTPIEILAPTTADLLSQLDIFNQRIGRDPRDKSQPIHNFLVENIRQLQEQATILDGQFCDTVLHSNPHNQILCIRQHPLLSKLAYGLAILPHSLSSSRRRIIRRIGVARSLLLNSIPDLILDATGYHITEVSRGIAGDLIRELGPQTALASIFYWGQIENRERDKYRIAGSVATPFDSPKLFWLSHMAVSELVDWRVRKKPLHNYLVSRYPALFSKQRTLPFEPN